MCHMGMGRCLEIQLEQVGVKTAVLPTNKELADIRKLSNRQFSSTVLEGLQTQLANPVLLGKAFYADCFADLESMLQTIGKAVIKAPWSSSGRGVRYVNSILEPALANWSKNVIKMRRGNND